MKPQQLVHARGLGLHSAIPSGQFQDMMEDVSRPDVAPATPLYTRGVERRRRPRVDSIVRAVVRSPGSANAPHRARAVDLCEDGARILLRRRLAIGAPIEIDLECELPLHLHLGYDADSLVVDGPMHTHLVRLHATAIRCERRSDKLYETGIRFTDQAAWHDMQVVASYVSHLREYESW